MFVHILLLIQGRRKYGANKSAREKCACTCARAQGVRGWLLEGWLEKEKREGKRVTRGRGGSSLVAAAFGGRNPLRAISGRAVFRGSQNGRRPTRLLHLVRGYRGLEFSPSCSLYTIFVRSFVRSFVSARCLAFPFADPVAGLHHLASFSLSLSLSLSLIIRVSSTPSSYVIYPSSWGVHPFLCISDRHYCWREAKFSVSFSLISLVFLPRFFFSSKVIPLSCSSSSTSFLFFPLPKRFLLRATTTTRCSSEVA